MFKLSFKIFSAVISATLILGSISFGAFAAPKADPAKAKADLAKSKAEVSKAKMNLKKSDEGLKQSQKEAKDKTDLKNTNLDNKYQHNVKKGPWTVTGDQLKTTINEVKAYAVTDKEMKTLFSKTNFGMVNGGEKLNSNDKNQMVLVVNITMKNISKTPIEESFHFPYYEVKTFETNGLYGEVVGAPKFSEAYPGRFAPIDKDGLIQQNHKSYLGNHLSLKPGKSKTINLLYVGSTDIKSNKTFKGLSIFGIEIIPIPTEFKEKATPAAMKKAINDGNLNEVKRLVSLNVPLDENAVRVAILMRNLELVKYLASVGATIKTETIDLASEIGALEIVKYLTSINVPISNVAISSAASNGHLEIVKHLVSEKAPLTRNAIENAVRTGQLEMIRYLVSINAPMNYYAITLAAQYNELDILKYLVSTGAPMSGEINESAIEMASQFGHLDVIKYLVSVKSPVNEGALFYASSNGHLDVVKYLISINAPIKKEEIIQVALENNHFEIADYLNSIQTK